MSIKIDPAKIVDLKYVGVPYKLGGKTLEGCDCIGMAIMWLRDHGVEYEYDDKQGPVLSHWWENSPRRFLNAVSQHGEIVHFADIKKHDLVLFFGREEFNRFPTCLGIMVDDRHFIIALETEGTAVRMMDKGWKNQFWGAIRLHKVVEAGL